MSAEKTVTPSTGVPTGSAAESHPVAASAAKPPCTGAASAPNAASVLVAASEMRVCCHGAGAEKSAPVQAAAIGHDTTSVSLTAAHAHNCHEKSEAVKTLVKELQSTDATQRLAAANSLGARGDRAAASPLIAALRDPDADVAHAAATALGRLGDASAVEPLIAVVNNAAGYFHGVVRIAATVSLGQLRDLRAVEPLQNAVNDPIAEASAESIRALAALGDQRAVTTLLEVVRNVNGYFLQTARLAAIVGLAKLGGDQATCELRFVASNQWEDAPIRNAAIEAIRETAAQVSAK